MSALQNVYIVHHVSVNYEFRNHLNRFGRQKRFDVTSIPYIAAISWLTHQYMV